MLNNNKFYQYRESFFQFSKSMKFGNLRFLYIILLLSMISSVSLADIKSEVKVQFYKDDELVQSPGISLKGSKLESKMHSESKEDLKSLGDYGKLLLMETLKEQLIKLMVTGKFGSLKSIMKTSYKGLLDGLENGFTMNSQFDSTYYEVPYPNDSYNIIKIIFTSSYDISSGILGGYGFDIPDYAPTDLPGISVSIDPQEKGKKKYTAIFTVNLDSISSSPYSADYFNDAIPLTFAIQENSGLTKLGIIQVFKLKLVSPEIYASTHQYNEGGYDNGDLNSENYVDTSNTFLGDEGDNDDPPDGLFPDPPLPNSEMSSYELTTRISCVKEGILFRPNNIYTHDAITYIYPQSSDLSPTLNYDLDILIDNKGFSSKLGHIYNCLIIDFLVKRIGIDDGTTPKIESLTSVEEIEMQDFFKAPSCSFNQKKGEGSMKIRIPLSKIRSNGKYFLSNKVSLTNPDGSKTDLPNLNLNVSFSKALLFDPGISFNPPTPPSSKPDPRDSFKHKITPPVGEQHTKPQIFVNPAIFGIVAIGVPKTIEIDINNLGTAELVVTDISATKDIIINPKNLKIKPGNSKKVSLTWQAKKKGNDAASISFSSNDPNSPTTNIGVTVTGKEKEKGKGK